MTMLLQKCWNMSFFKETHAEISRVKVTLAIYVQMAQQTKCSRRHVRTRERSSRTRCHPWARQGKQMFGHVFCRIEKFFKMLQEEGFCKHFHK